MNKNKIVWLIVGVVIGGLAMVLLQGFGIIKPSFNKSKASDLSACYDQCEFGFNYCKKFIGTQSCYNSKNSCFSNCQGQAKQELNLAE